MLHFRHLRAYKHPWPIPRVLGVKEYVILILNSKQIALNVLCRLQRVGQRTIFRPRRFSRAMSKYN
jgi:hypothetical protein